MNQRLAPVVSALREHRWRIVGIAAALVIVVAGKQYYRDATAAELAWILAPTAQLVSWVSGGNFLYEAGPGWVDPQIGFIIAPPCAGVNFALAAFLALALGGAMSMTSPHTIALRLAGAAAMAYLATLVVNTIRIAIAIAMHRGTIDIRGYDRAELHRIEGIVVYLGGLIALYAVARAVEHRRRPATRTVVRWLTIPLAAYLVITLALPVANGAASRSDFAHHAQWVVGSCVAVLGIFLLVPTFTNLVRPMVWRK